MMPQCWQIYSDSYNIILFCTYMCYIPPTTYDGSDISCMYYFNLIWERQDQLPQLPQHTNPIDVYIVLVLVEDTLYLAMM